MPGLGSKQPLQQQSFPSWFMVWYDMLYGGFVLDQVIDLVLSSGCFQLPRQATML